MDIVYVIILAYVFLNVVSLALFGLDKYKAKRNKFRISEKTLLIISLFGPFGAIIGMKKFRHKTQKSLFKIIYVFAFLHLIVLIYIFGAELNLF